MWGKPVELVIEGEPRRKARPRVTLRGAYTPAATRRYERKVAQAAMASGERCPAGLLSVSIVLYLPRPQSRPRQTSARLWTYAEPFHVGRADADNLAKSVLDGLGPWLGDDRRVVELHVEKRCSSDPRAVVSVRGLEDSDGNE